MPDVFTVFLNKDDDDDDDDDLQQSVGRDDGRGGAGGLDKGSLYHCRIRQKRLTITVNLFGLCLEN